ncbi:MAG: acyl--CoA ligase [Clostridia bacterium]|nr:acyl--CoA ligase [Clostridia bacterium]
MRSYIPGSTAYHPVGDFNVYDYFLMNTEQYGDYPAFQHAFRDHMRSELVEDIESLAYFFKKTIGLRQGDVYTIFLPTSIEAMIIFMALNKLGVIVNFVHPLLPPEKLAELLTLTRSCGIAILDRATPKYAATIGKFHLSALVCSFDTYGVPDKYSVSLAPGASQSLSDNEVRHTSFHEALASCKGKTCSGVTACAKEIAVYMSGGGTTGKSRTIMLSNYALNNVIYMCGCINERPEHPGIDTDIGCMPFFHAYGFCVGGLSSLVKATKMVFMPSFDADKFIEIMKLNHVVQFNGVPNMFKKLLAHPEWDGPQLASMRIAFGGGDDVGASFLHKFNDVFKKNRSIAELHQGYGLTECCAIVLTNPIDANKEDSIGKALPGLTVQIWDENQKELPNGEIGEIAISGPTLMEGYLREDGQPGDGLYTDETGRKWVLSGDLAYRDDDGFFFFAGRKKRLIIISGYNVYPADIERVLVELPFIKESCPVQGFDDNGKKLVRLYVVLGDDADRGEEYYRAAITAACASKLSRFSVPRDIRFITALPRTAVQKVDFMKMTQKKPEDPIY